MPLEQEHRDIIDAYTKRHLPKNMQWYLDQFDFVADTELKKRLARAYYAARYMSKLLAALFTSGNEMHPFVKFQILQYASIYEAVVVYLLWNRYRNTKEVDDLEHHIALTKVSAFAKDATLTVNGESAVAAVNRRKKTPKTSIPFKDKVDCAVKIGFVGAAYAGDLKRIYELRNLAHIEAEAADQTEVELVHSRLAYRRMGIFLRTIREKIKKESALAPFASTQLQVSQPQVP
jgi:hypothetical protein